MSIPKAWDSERYGRRSSKKYLVPAVDSEHWYIHNEFTPLTGIGSPESIWPRYVGFRGRHRGVKRCTYIINPT
jgi:hypothetical protein